MPANYENLGGGFKDLKREIDKHKNKFLSRSSRHELLDEGTSVSTEEIVEARALLSRLETNASIAYQRRKKKWFEAHPGKKYFEETSKEMRQNITFDEWIWSFTQRILITPEQRYQEEKNPDHGWNHFSDVHTIDEPYKEGCRF